MKKVILLASVVCASISSFARDNAFLAKKGDKGIISKGFYLNLGVGMPSGKGDGEGLERESFGIQPSLEIGNQWYFFNNDKIGVGLKVSWFQFGFSSHKDTEFKTKTTTLDLKFLKFGPQFSMALSDNSALDFSVEVEPTYFIQSYKSTESSIDYSGGGLGFGLLVAPGARFRYNKFAVGVDCGFGKATLVGTGDLDGMDSFKVSMLQPRLYAGFKF
jgi:hypothetical protein